MIKLKNLLNEVSYEKSGLEKPALADRNKDKKISPWEKKVAKNIEKNIDENGDIYNIGMKKYKTETPRMFEGEMCNECGGAMYEGMCSECGYDISADEQSPDHEVGMAQNLIKDIIKNAMELSQKIGTNEINLPGWIQDHISQSQNFISQANVGYHTLD